MRSLVPQVLTAVSVLGGDTQDYCIICNHEIMVVLSKNRFRFRVRVGVRVRVWVGVRFRHEIMVVLSNTRLSYHDDIKL